MAGGFATGAGIALLFGLTWVPPVGLILAGISLGVAAASDS